MQRYFDGANWGQFAPPLRPPAPAKTGTSPTKAILAVTGLIVLLVIIGRACGSAGENSGSSKSSSTSSSSTAWGATTTTTTPRYSEREIEQGVIHTCQEAIKQDLKDPDSAKFGDDWRAWLVTHYDEPPKVTFHPENGDKLYSAGGMVNAKNSFGGYVGYQAYGCEASITASGDIRAHAYSLDEILNPTATP